MQRLSGKGPSCKDLKGTKLASNTSRNKRDLKSSSSKNIKTVKGFTTKGQNPVDETKIRQNASPDTANKGKQLDNDYGVNPYYAKHKVKTSHKKQHEEANQNTDYGTFKATKESLNKSQFEASTEKGSKTKIEDSDYVESAFQKIKLPTCKGLINAEGKFVNRIKPKQHKNHSFQSNSNSKHSFSLNFNSREESKYRKKGKSKSKSKKTTLDDHKSFEYKTKSKSSEKVKDHQSYFQRSRQEQEKSRQYKLNKHKQSKKSQQQISIKDNSVQQGEKVKSIDSKTTSIGTEVEVYSAISLTQNNAFVESVKDEIMEQIKAQAKKSYIQKGKLSQNTLRQRLKCLQMLSKTCGALNAKRQALFLAIQYLDTYISQFPYQSMKIISLGCLTLALKMDDAQIISKFCFHYPYNLEKTVKKNRNSNHLKLKQKRQSTVGKEETRSNLLQSIINVKISDDKKNGREDFSLEEILDCQNHIMIKFGFKLMIKTVNYWADMLTALWDSYIDQFCPKYIDTLIFRNDNNPRNFSYVLQIIELESISMGIYSKSNVSMVLAAIYLVTRMALQQKKEETPWDQICRFYKISLSKTTNLIFCDGVGINVLFGDFLTLFDLSMADIIEHVQHFSKYLQPNLFQSTDYRKVQGLSREDRITTHISNDELYKNHQF